MSKVDRLADNLPKPTKEDKERIRRIILRYEKKYPGRINYTIRQAKADQRENSTAFDDKTAFGVVDKASRRRHLLELPEDLMRAIEVSYPTMFRSRQHFQWFMKSFPELRIPEKY